MIRIIWRGIGCTDFRAEWVNIKGYVGYIGIGPICIDLWRGVCPKG